MGDYSKWTVSALKTTCRKLYKANEKVLKEIEGEISCNDLAQLVYAQQGSKEVQYHNWTKEHLQKEVADLHLDVTGNKAALIAALSKQSNKSSKTTKKTEQHEASSDSSSEENTKGTKRQISDNEDDNDGSKDNEGDSGEKIAASPAKSILKSPKKPSSPAKRAKVEKGDKGKLKFSGVEVRQYSRRHGGGGGVPHSGAYPLGLDWEYDKEHVLKRGLTDFEEMRADERHTKGSIPAVNEKERQKLLENADDRAHVERASSFTKQKGDLDNLRKVRKKIGCECDGTECQTSKCVCYKSGVECLEDYCSCAHCENPKNI